MKLHIIEINNYRSIKNLILEFDTDINLLVGPNGCGKTNIIQAINTCFESLIMDYNTFRNTDIWFGIDKLDIQIKGIIIHKENTNTFVLDYNSSQNTHSISSKLNPNIIGYYKYVPSDRYFRSSNFGIRDSRVGFREKFDNRFNDSREVFQSYFDMMVNSPNNLLEISNVISDIYPDLKEIRFLISPGADQAQLIAIINDFAVPIHLLASGVQQLITLILDIYYSKESLILIDEPELHMNPKMIIGLSNLIKRSANDNKNQFIIGTHSPALISTLKGNIISLEYGKRDEGYTTYITDIIPNEFLDKSKILGGE